MPGCYGKDCFKKEQDEKCAAPKFTGPDADYSLTPREMLDWTPTTSDGEYTTEGFRPRSRPAPKVNEYKREPGFIGANEGRLRSELRWTWVWRNNPPGGFRI